jgi:hypothetical protein
LGLAYARYHCFRLFSLTTHTTEVVAADHKADERVLTRLLVDVVALC